MKNFIYENDVWVEKLPIELTSSQYLLITSKNPKEQELKENLLKKIEEDRTLTVSEADIQNIKNFIDAKIEENLADLTVRSIIVNLDFENDTILGYIYHEVDQKIKTIKLNKTLNG